MLKFFFSLIQGQKDKEKDLSKNTTNSVSAPLNTDSSKVTISSNALLLLSEQNIIFRHLPPINESRRRSFSEIISKPNHTNPTTIQKTSLPKELSIVSERTLAFQEILVLRAERAERRKSIVDVDISQIKKRSKASV